MALNTFWPMPLLPSAPLGFLEMQKEKKLWQLDWSLSSLYQILCDQERGQRNPTWRWQLLYLLTTPIIAVVSLERAFKWPGCSHCLLIQEPVGSMSISSSLPTTTATSSLLVLCMKEEGKLELEGKVVKEIKTWSPEREVVETAEVRQNLESLLQGNFNEQRFSYIRFSWAFISRKSWPELKSLWQIILQQSWPQGWRSIELWLEGRLWTPPLTGEKS